MKKLNLFVVLLVFAVNAFAADAFTERLQRGLFEEEANRNLDAAIKEYQSVVTQADEQRKVVATALFRLGECYRKLGKTNEAAAFYQRVARDFSEQEQLVRLASDLLKVRGGATATGPQSEYIGELRRRLATLRANSLDARMEADRLTQLGREQFATNDSVFSTLQMQLFQVEQKLTTLKGQFGNEHPEVKTTVVLQEKIAKQIEDRWKGKLDDARRFADSLAEQVSRFAAELKKAEGTADVTAQTTGDTPALTQAEADAFALAKSLVQNSPDLLNAPPSAGGFTPLQSAVSKGHHYVATFLLSNGADPNAGGSSPALVLAARNGNLRLVEMLLDKGADVNGFNGEGKTALMTASEQGFKNLVEVLLARGADVNRQTYTQETALHFAVFKGHATLVELLLKRGARADVLSLSTHVSGIPGLGSGTPLHYTAHWGHSNIAELLLAAGAPVDATNRSGQTPLHLAAASGKTNLCALLLDRGAKIDAVTLEGGTPLAYAVVNNHEETAALTAALLVARGADVNQPSFRSRPDAPNPLFLAVVQNKISALRSILTAKPNLEAINRDNFTPLQMAMSANLDEAAVVLLEAGADPNRTYAEGYTLLHNAVSRGRLWLVEALLKRGANPNVVSRHGETPLSSALNSLRRLAPAQPGARPFRPLQPGNPAGASVVTVPGLPPTSFRLNAANPDGTPNPAREREDYEEIVTLLKSHGADEFLQRRGFISVVRGPELSARIFQRGTNEWNRHTLMELIGAVYENGGQDFPFPDFSKITIYRLDGKTEKPFPVDGDDMLAVTNDCSKDVALEWGDNVEIPMADHPVNAGWNGLWGKSTWTLSHCLQRTVRIFAGNTNASITLYYRLAPTIPGRAPEYVPGYVGGRPQSRSAFLRLSYVLYRDARFQNLLRSSSDVSRVLVTRVDPVTKETKKLTFDLNAVALPDMNYSSGNQPPIPWQQDLWLRDGDVIEVPEKL